MSQLRLSALLAALLALPAVAASPREVPGVRSGLVVNAPNGRDLAERVTFAADTADRLVAAGLDEELAVSDWPIAPGQRARVTLKRREIYAPDAHVYRADAKGLVELPRSPLVFFEGRVAGDAGGRAVAWVDPATGTLEGVTLGAGAQEIRHEKGSPAREALVGLSSALAPEALTWACGQEEIPPDVEAGAAALPAPAPASLAVPLASAAATKQIVIAFDTDNELMSLKFGNDTTAATNYVAALVAVMSPIYERDLSVKIVQGTLILRPSTTTDPYTTNPGGNANLAYLQEFSNYWSANYGAVSRGLAQLLSGKQPNANNASGIAWLNGLCSTSSGYSVAEVFKFAQQTASNDALVNAHEIGHNFGSPHTHCPYGLDPPIDHCFSGEGGSCYSGATSCPAPATYQGVANVTGTLMSYCHLLSGCSSSLVFHSITVTHLLSSVAAASCVTAISSYTPVASQFHTLAPCRVLDTRNAAGPLGGPMLAGSGAQRTFTVTGTCGIPSSAKSITANVTVVTPSAAGDLRIFPGDQSLPTSTTIHFPGGRTRANNAHLLLSTNGAGAVNVVSEGGATHFILDVNGYYQ